METKIFIQTLLALTIQVLVSAQTQNKNIHRILSPLGSHKPQVTPVLLTSNLTPNEIPTVIKSSNLLNILVTSPQSLHSKDSVMNNTTFNYYHNPHCYITAIYANALLKQSDELYFIEEFLRKQSSNQSLTEKKTLSYFVSILQNQALCKQIQASEITGKINMDAFKGNRPAYCLLLLDCNDSAVIEEATTLYIKANLAFNSATQLREEAYTMSDISQKLGVLNNAEEKEKDALEAQYSAINLLQHSIVAAMRPGKVNIAKN